MDVIDFIHGKQKAATFEQGVAPPVHAPEMLLVGCVDARLDIIGDIGIPKGKALVMRNIAALVAGAHEELSSRPIEGATLQFAVDVMKVKHIVVMGHTDCGGIRAQLEGADIPQVQSYLEPLRATCEEIKERGGNITRQAREMEQAAVRISLQNLRTYESVEKAEAAGKLKLHGWVIDTATGKLMVLDEQKGTFSQMTEKKQG